jgi:UDP-N-acetylmuramate--alanine ligase
LADVYPAGEAPIEGIDKEHLVEGLRSGGHRDARRLMAAGDLPAMIAGLAAPGDMVVCLGAGSITSWAQELPDALAALDEK